jgi:hypothetical protein
VREILKAKNMSHTETPENAESQKQFKSHGLSLCTL